MRFAQSYRSEILGKLAGPVGLRVVVDKASIDAAAADVGRAVGLNASRLASTIGDNAVNMLAALYQGSGYRRLASEWTRTPTVSDARSARTEVYSRAENTEYTHRAPFTFEGGGAPPETRIPGRLLLQILNYGAVPHSISARDPYYPLKFPIRRGESQSRFSGTILSRRGAEVASFSGDRPTTFFRGAYVEHPGVIGNRFIQLVKERIVAGIAARGTPIAPA